MRVNLPASSPVIDFESFDFDITVVSRNSGPLVPTQRGARGRVDAIGQIERIVRRDNVRLARQRAQSYWIEVVHMRVRKQHQINLWQLRHLQGGSNQALRPNVSEECIRSDALAKDGVGQDVETVKVEKNT